MPQDQLQEKAFNGATNPLKGKQTPGVAVVERHEHGQYFGNIVLQKGGGVIQTITCQLKYAPPEEQEADAALYAEAHNVANESGLWPREMQARISKLEQELREERERIGKLEKALDSICTHVEQTPNDNVVGCNMRATIPTFRALLSPEKTDQQP